MNDLRDRLPDQPDPRPRARGQQRAREPPWVNRTVRLGEQTTANGRVQHGLQAAAFPRRQPAARDAEAVVQRVQLVDDSEVVGVVADLEGAGPAETGRLARGRGQLGHEAGVALQRRRAEHEELLFRVAGFGDRREHAGRGMTGALAGGGVGDGHAEPALGGAPGDAQADHSAAGHDHCRQSPSLPSPA